MVSIDTLVPIGMLLNASVAAVFLVLSVVFLVIARGGKTTVPKDSWDLAASHTFAFIFAALTIATGLALRR